MKAVVFAVLALALGCGGSSTGPSLDSLLGTWQGTVAAHGTVPAATVSFTLSTGSNGLYFGSGSIQPTGGALRSYAHVDATPLYTDSIRVSAAPSTSGNGFDFTGSRTASTMSGTISGDASGQVTLTKR